ncbi:MAG: hypothetical protein ACYCSO_04855 [Cuniculiplasma sp.]|nr:MAG: hypothetical protein AMDU5_GPLC00015G0004 [Thermoplasmatales archaeon Gpl]
MVDEEKLKSVIENTRRVSQDSSLVIYDLTQGVDFSNPKFVAKALSEVFFEKDAINWFKVEDDRVDFNPTYKVRVVLAEEHNKLLENTVDDFLKDIQKDDISKAYSRQIKDGSEKATGLQSTMAAGAIKSSIFRHSEEKVFSGEIRDDLFTDILENLEIKSLNDKDLMDWKNLPL